MMDEKSEELFVAESFKCPRCGAPRLEEVMTNVIVKSEILSIGVGGAIHYGGSSQEAGKVDGYQCLDCGWTVPGVHNAEELHAWFANPNRDMSDVGEDDRRAWLDDENYVKMKYPDAHISTADDGKIEVWACSDVIGVGTTPAQAWSCAADYVQ